VIHSYSASIPSSRSVTFVLLGFNTIRTEQNSLLLRSTQWLISQLKQHSIETQPGIVFSKTPRHRNRAFGETFCLFLYPQEVYHHNSLPTESVYARCQGASNCFDAVREDSRVIVPLRVCSYLTIFPKQYLRCIKFRRDSARRDTRVIRGST